EVTGALAEALGIDALNLDLQGTMGSATNGTGRAAGQRILSCPVDVHAAHLISLETASRLAALPIACADGEVAVAFADPLFEPAAEELEDLLGLRVRPYLAPRSAVEDAIQQVMSAQTELVVTGLRDEHQVDLLQRSILALPEVIRLESSYSRNGTLHMEVSHQPRADLATRVQQLPAFKLRLVSQHPGLVRFELLSEPGVYELRVDVFFEARHFVTLEGESGPIHPHSYRMQLRCRSTQLKQEGHVVVGFRELRQSAEEVVGAYNNRLLNNLPQFETMQPTTENLAVVLYRELRQALADFSVELSSITLWESPTEAVTYTEAAL
ncbi:MAG: hypothetical protein D6791_10405, partial [Chloroflexi bacterium]